ncbi:MAG: S8 family peptidase [Pseudomonadota bacterium]
MKTHTDTKTKESQRDASRRTSGGKPMNARTTTLALLGFAGALGLMTTLATDRAQDAATAVETMTVATTDLRLQTTVSGDVMLAPTTARSVEGAAFDFDLATAPEASGEFDRAAVVTAAEASATPSLAQRATTDAQRERSDIDPASKMSGRLAALAASGGDTPVEVVVSYADHPELFDDARVAELGGEIVRSYTNLDVRAIRLPAASLNDLALETRVDRLSLDAPVMSVSEAARLAANVPEGAQANAVWEGAGVGVAIIDSGIANHSVLADAAVQYDFTGGKYPVPIVSNGEIITPNSVVRDDKFGHGTHVAGIVAGSGADSAGEFQGSSVQAPLLAMQVLDKKGAGNMSDVMAALDWLLSYGQYYDVRVVNLSLGKTVSESNTTDPLVLAAEALWDAGIVVVVAAGNDGHNGNFTINSPGNSRKLITVGSLTDGGTGNDFSDDYVSTFSSRGPTVGDLVLKPDLVAPGNKVVAAIPNDSELKKLLPQRDGVCSKTTCSGLYLELSGTSMATPMVAAAAARMLAKDPTLSPDTIKARLMRSARKVDGEPTSYGAGVLDVEAALNETGTVSGIALSPIMIRDEASNGILVEDTGGLWSDSQWAAGFLYYSGFNWSQADGSTTENALSGISSTGFMWSDEVGANGFLWSDEGVWANGFLWSDEGTGENVWARGFLWSDEAGGTGARSLLDTDWDTYGSLSDDP